MQKNFLGGIFVKTKVKKFLALMLTFIMMLSVGIVHVNAKLTLWKKTTDTFVREFLYEDNSADTSAANFTSSGKYNVKGSGTDDVAQYVGEIKRETVMGKDFKHVDFKGMTVNGTFDSKKNAIRIQLAYKDQTDATILKDDGNIKENAVNANFSNIYSTLRTDKALLYTFYGYSDNPSDGTYWTADFMRSTSSAGPTARLENLDICSSNGVPHRIDVVVYATGTSSNDYMRLAIYVDGVLKNSAGRKIGEDFKNSRLAIYRQLDASPDYIAFPEFSHHFSYMYDLFTTNIKITPKDRSEIESLMVTKPDWCDTTDATHKETAGTKQDFTIDNVSDELETEINKVLKSSDVEKSIDVISLDGIITKEGTAKVIKISDGTEVEDLSTVTAEEVVLDINGIYISLNQLEAGYDSLDVDANGKADLIINKADNTTAYTSKLIIAGYDDDKMISCKVFDVDIAANADIKQYVYSQTYEVDGATRYKAFCFKGLSDPVPLVEAGDSSK